MTIHELALDRSPSAALWSLMATVAVVGSQSFALSPLVPDLARTLDTDPAAVGRAVAAYGLSTAAAALLVGRRVDRLSRRRVLQTAGAGLTLALVVVATASSIAALVVGQALAGVSAGVLLPVAYAAAGDSVPPSERTRALGLVLSGWSVAMVVAVPAAAVMSEWVGWRGVFAVLAFSSAVSALTLRRVPDRHLVSNGDEPVSYLSALRSPGVPALLCVVAAFMASFYGVYTYLGAQLRGVEGTAVTTAGLAVMVYGLGFGLSTLVDARVDRFGPNRLLAPVLTALAGLYAALALVLTADVVLPVVGLVAVWGLLNHLGLSLLVGRLLERCPGAPTAVLALNSAVTYAAGAAGAAAAGHVFGAHGLAPVAALAAVACGLGAVTALSSVRTRTAPAP